MHPAHDCIRAYCPLCRADLTCWQDRTKTPPLTILRYILDCEKRTRQNLYGHNDCSGRNVPFEPIADIAFLLFHSGLSRSAGLSKKRLRGWGDATQPPVTFPLLEARMISDNSLLYPLATANPRKRSYLLVAAMAAIERVDIAEGEFRNAPYSLEDLFFSLDEDCREEMIRRADAWPGDLKDEVKRIIRKPLKGSRSPSPGGWEASSARKALHDGRIPGYGPP